MGEQASKGGEADCYHGDLDFESGPHYCHDKIVGWVDWVAVYDERG